MKLIQANSIRGSISIPDTMISQTAIENQKLGRKYTLLPTFHTIRVVFMNIASNTTIDEKLTCLATFASEDTGQNYLIGILDEPYINDLTSKLRCFLYSAIDDGRFRIAQSEDSSCAPLVDVEKDGNRNIQMTVGKL